MAENKFLHALLYIINNSLVMLYQRDHLLNENYYIIVVKIIISIDFLLCMLLYC